MMLLPDLNHFRNHLGQNLFYILAEDIIYYQRPLKSQIHGIAECRFEKKYIETKDKVEIDLVIETSNQQTFLISFEGSQKIIPAHLKNLSRMGRNLPYANLIIVTEAQNELIDPRIRKASATQFFLEVSRLK